MVGSFEGGKEMGVVSSTLVRPTASPARADEKC